MRRFAHAMGLGGAVRFELDWLLGTREINARVKGYPEPFVLRRGDSDEWVFDTVFVQHELEVLLPRSPALIIDGGANIGLSTAYYARRYPDAQIIAIEPDAANCAALLRNCAAFTNVRLLQGGLWPESGWLRLVNSEAASWSFKCEPSSEGAPGAFRAFSMRDVLDLSGASRCDLLKLDIEGGEAELFSRNVSDWLHRVDAILVEIHGEKAAQAVRSACCETEFASREAGEKLLLQRR
jgi:FkbM family methyltransferase